LKWFGYAEEQKDISDSIYSVHDYHGHDWLRYFQENNLSGFQRKPGRKNNKIKFITLPRDHVKGQTRNEWII